MIASVKALDLSLDKLMLCDNAHLNAVVPQPMEMYSEALRWTEKGGNEDSIKSNLDLEERFHWIYGPFLLKDYKTDLKYVLKMFSGSVDGFSLYGEEEIKTHTCSTLRIDMNSRSTIPHVKRIFIRPCLQNYKILGRIVESLSTSRYGGFKIDNCSLKMVEEMEKYCDGANSAIFNRTKNANGLINITVSADGTKTLQALFKKIEFPRLPSHRQLNACVVTKYDAEWAFVADRVHTLRIDSNLLQHHFRSGYANMTVDDFRDACMYLRDDFESVISEYEITSIDDSSDEDYRKCVDRSDLIEADVYITNMYMRCIKHLNDMIDTVYTQKRVPFSRMFGYLEYKIAIRYTGLNVFFHCIQNYLTEKPSMSRTEAPNEPAFYRGFYEHLASMKGTLSNKRIVLSEEDASLSLDAIDVRQVSQDIHDKISAVCPVWKCLSTSLSINDRLSLQIDKGVVTLNFDSRLDRGIAQFLSKVKHVIQ